MKGRGKIKEHKLFLTIKPSQPISNAPFHLYGKTTVTHFTLYQLQPVCINLLHLPLLFILYVNLL